MLLYYIILYYIILYYIILYYIIECRMLDPEHERNAWSVIMLITRQTSYNRSFQLQPVDALSIQD